MNKDGEVEPEGSRKVYIALCCDVFVVPCVRLGECMLA